MAGNSKVGDLSTMLLLFFLVASFLVKSSTMAKSVLEWARSASTLPTFGTPVLTLSAFGLVNPSRMVFL